MCSTCTTLELCFGANEGCCFLTGLGIQDWQQYHRGSVDPSGIIWHCGTKWPGSNVLKQLYTSSLQQKAMSKMICSNKIHVKFLKELCWLHYLDKSEGDWSKPGRHVPESWNNQERKWSSFSIHGDTVLLHIRRSGLASTNLHPPGVLWSGATRSDSDDDWPLMLIMNDNRLISIGKYLAICFDICYIYIYILFMEVI